MAVPSVARTLNARRKKLDKLRVIVADAIFCYGVNRDSEPKDISLSAAAHELSGQYSLKILLNWLATKYGFPVYACGINPRNQADLEPLAAWGELRLRYPLNTPEHIWGQGTEGGARREAAWRAAFEFLEENFEPDLELIGELYMRLLCTRERGEFYTPQDVVDTCLAGLDAACEGRPDFKLLDPACGSGNFLLGALRAFSRARWTHDSLVDFAARGLFGRDVDPRAVSLAQLSIVIALREAPLIDALARHITVCDALVSVDDLAALQADVVVSNPPYVSFGSRGQTASAESWSKFVRSEFPESSEYKIRLHSVFQQLGIKIVKDGGTVIMLVPDAFLTGAYYKKLREYICRNAEILSFVELPESTFPDAVAGKWCISKYRKSVISDALQPANTVAVSDTSAAPYMVPQSELVDASDKWRFNLVFNDAEHEISSNVRGLPKLRLALRGHTGMRSRNGQKKIVSESARGATWKRGITSGAQVEPYHVSYEGHWLNTDAPGLFSGGFDPAIVEKPKLLVRQTADRIIAALDEEQLYHLNNVHSFSPAHAGNLSDFSLEALEYFAGLFNSSFWLFLYQLRARERKRALAQIDIEMIEAMPIPTPAGHDDIIAGLVREIRGDATKTPHLQRYIDARVYELYGLSSTSIEYIERTLRDQGYIAAPLPVAADERTCYIH